MTETVLSAHTVEVLTNQSLKAILQRLDTSGRMAKWAIKLSEFDVAYRPRLAMKFQVLADFIAEYTLPEDEDRPKEQSGGPDQPGPSWILHVDGASNTHESGAGLILTGPDEIVAECALRFSFPASNNQAEYKALLAGLRMAKEMAIKRLSIHRLPAGSRVGYQGIQYQGPNND